MQVICEYCDVPTDLLEDVGAALALKPPVHDVAVLSDGNGFVEISQRRAPGCWEIFAEGDCETDTRASMGYMASCMRRGPLLETLRGFCQKFAQPQLFA
jgi:hypothetical protein